MGNLKFLSLLWMSVYLIIISQSCAPTYYLKDGEISRNQDTLSPKTLQTDQLKALLFCQPETEEIMKSSVKYDRTQKVASIGGIGIVGISLLSVVLVNTATISLVVPIFLAGTSLIGSALFKYESDELLKRAIDVYNNTNTNKIVYDSVFAIAGPSKAQKRNNSLANNTNFGISAGINSAGFKTISNVGWNVQVNRNFGLDLHLIVDYRISKSLIVRVLPGIQFMQRDLTINNDLNPDTKTFKIESIILELPIMLNFQLFSEKRNSPYLLCGITPRYDSMGRTISAFSIDDRLLKGFDFGPDFGVGINFKKPKFNLSVELKLSVGMLDIYQLPSPSYQDLVFYNSSISKMYSRMMVLSFHID